MRFTHHIQTIKSSLVYRVVARMGFEFSRHSSWEPLCYDQGRNEVRWRPGQEVWRTHVRNWALSETNVLYCSTCDIVGTFRRPPFPLHYVSD